MYTPHYLLPRWTPELSRFLGGNSGRQVGLLDLGVAAKLVRLQLEDKVRAERYDGLHAMPQLDVAHMMQHVTHLQLRTLSHLHVQ